MNTKSHKYNVKDESGIADYLISELLEKGAVRLIHFGLFKITEIKGRKQFRFKDRKVVSVPSFKKVSFTASKGLRDMININKAKKKKSG